MAALYNLAKMTTSTTGTGTITLGSAVSGFLSFSGAGVQNGEIVSYGIADGANSEVGTGTYTSSGTTLTRTVTTSTNSNSPISLSGSAQVYITARAEDFGKVLLETHTASSSATLDFTLTDSSRFAYYELVLDNIAPVTDATDLWLRCSSNGGSTYDTATNYDHVRAVIQAPTTNAAAGSTSDSKILLAGALSNTAGSRALNGIIKIYDSGSNYVPVTWQVGYTTSSPTITGAIGSARYVSTANAFRLLMSSGNISSGTARLYGIVK